MNIEKSNILIINDNEEHQILMEEALIQFIQEANVVLTGTSEECFLELLKVNI